MDMDELWYVPAAGGAAARANLGPVYDASFQPGGPGRLVGRGSHSSTLWLNLSALCGIGAAFGVV